MARKASLPGYRYHVSGQAVVTFRGKNFYLGVHDTPESWAKYHQLCAEYLRLGMAKAPDADEQLGEAPISVRCLTAEFREHVKTRYANNKRETQRFQNLCDLLDYEYGDTPASEFGPRKLAAVRDIFVASGNCRRYVNEQTRCVARIFKFGVSRELIDPYQLVALESLEPLRYGQTTAAESKVVGPVDLEIVKETAKHLSPVLQAMIRIQAATGMRSGELCSMRPCDVERRPDGVWMYRPAQHKTKHHGKSKAIPLVADAKLALKPYLDREETLFCFSPKESVAWYRLRRSSKRKTPLSCGTKPGDKFTANPKRSAGDRFNSASYRRAIKRATTAAKVEHWHPHQLRHTAASAIREALGIEYVQAILGHSQRAVSEHYAKLSESKAITAAKAAPSIG